MISYDTEDVEDDSMYALIRVCIINDDNTNHPT